MEAFCALGDSVKEFDLTVGDAGGNAATPSPPVTTIPASLATCFPNLHKCKLSFNSLKGEIPAFLGTMKRLSYIKLASNKLIGSIPKELASSPALFFLDVSDNNLSGSLPEFNGKLGYLDVSKNDVEGPIDKALASAVGLQAVGLKGNAKLCGPVPSSVRWAVGYDAEGTGLGKPCGSSSPAPEKKKEA